MLDSSEVCCRNSFQDCASVTVTRSQAARRGLHVSPAVVLQAAVATALNHAIITQGGEIVPHPATTQPPLIGGVSAKITTELRIKSVINL